MTTTHQKEIDRDDEVCRHMMWDELRRLREDTRVRPLRDAEVELAALEIVIRSRQHRRALANARTKARHESSGPFKDSLPLPADLVWFRHRGSYHGEFTMKELGNILRLALGLHAGMPPDARIRVAYAMHLEGDIWTLPESASRAVHVFARPGSRAEELLHLERPQIEVQADELLTPCNGPLREENAPEGAGASRQCTKPRVAATPLFSGGLPGFDAHTPPANHEGEGTSPPLVSISDGGLAEVDAHTPPANREGEGASPLVPIWDTILDELVRDGYRPAVEVQ